MVSNLLFGASNNIGSANCSISLGKLLTNKNELYGRIYTGELCTLIWSNLYRQTIRAYHANNKGTNLEKNHVKEQIT